MSECQTAREAALDALVTGSDLPAAARRHLNECMACRAELRDMHALWQDLGRLPTPIATIPSAEQAWRLAHSQPEPGRILMRKTHLIAALFACLLLGGLAGYALQSRTPVAADAKGSTFLLLLHEAAASDAQYTAAQMNAIVGEYRDWADRLNLENRLVSAEKLRNDSRWLAPDGKLTAVDRPEIVSGFFLLRARDYDEAMELARTSPHLKYGGTIEVRAIENTTP